MGELRSHIFTIIVSICFVLSFSIFIHFIYSITHTPASKLLRTLSIVSLSGFNAHILITCLLYSYDSIYYLNNDNTPYQTLICTSHSFNIIFFVIGKISMYYFFLSLVHVSFRGSFMKYNKSLLKSIAIIFTIIMVSIFVIYAYSSYIDIQNIGSIQTPKQCSHLTVSKLSTITIWTSYDAYTLFLINMVNNTSLSDTKQ